VTEAILKDKPDIVHFTNTFPLITLSGPAAAHDAGVPVVASMHNYRAMCASAYFLRNGKVCEKCLGSAGSMPAVLHKCYRDSHISSLAMAGTIAWQRGTNQWGRYIDLFCTPSRYASAKLIQGGFPRDRVVVKQNFVANSPLPGTGKGGFALFAGRLSPEKGLNVLLGAWRADSSLPPLLIVGEGPLADQATIASSGDSRIKYLGKLPLAKLLELMGEAICLLMPSIWYETFGRTMIEAYSKGTPVIASNMGCMAELVKDGTTGFLFEPGSSQSLAEAIHRLMKQPKLMSTFRSQCRQAFESDYTSEQNYQLLTQLYKAAIEIQKTSRK